MSIKHLLPVAGILALSGLIACHPGPTELCATSASPFTIAGQATNEDVDDEQAGSVADPNRDADDGLSSEPDYLGTNPGNSLEADVVSCGLAPQFSEDEES